MRRYHRTPLTRPGTQAQQVCVIIRALLAAGGGGTVTLGAGVFLLEPDRGVQSQNSGFRLLDAAICLPPSLGGLPITLQGAGAATTVLRQGAVALNAFWGSAVSLRDLTVTNALLPGEKPVVPPNTYTGRPALWSMDTYSGWPFNITDLAFTNVHFVASRENSIALVLRYTRTAKVRNCTFDYHSLVLMGPTQDVQIIGCTARL
jgi:hypothetical protein